MAFDQTQYQLNTGSIPPELAQELWAKAEQESAIMQLAQRVEIPGRGHMIPVMTGNAAADWTVETGEKPVDTADLTMKYMIPYKLAIIETFSEEFERDLEGLYRELVRRLPAAIGKKLDQTVFNGVAPGTGFDVLTGSTDISIAADPAATPPVSVYDNLITVLQTLGASGYDLNGFALSAQGQALVLGAVDNAGRPLFINNAITDGSIGQILGARVVKAQESYEAGTPNTIGFAGDWSQMRYGIVDGFKVSVSRDASLNDGNGGIIHLFQRNMLAVRVEAEIGVAVANPAAFVKLTD